MKTKIIILAIFLVVSGGLIFLFINHKTSPVINPPSSNLIDIDYNGVKVKVVIDKPENKDVDVILVYHGTTMDDSMTIKAAETMLGVAKKIIEKDNIMIISVAYPGEGLLMGDNIRESEAALLWTKNKASKELGVKINKIYLLGHSQGGYLVTRLNTMHETDGVIANGAGPIDLGFRCKLDEEGKIEYKERQQDQGEVCRLLEEEYDSVFDNSLQYTKRSMISFASGYKSKILFIQGMKDKKVQMILWSKFKEKLEQCTDCAEYKIMEIENSGHRAAFEDPGAIEAINNFLLK